ncbi:MAG: RNA-binding transcriptional accessory protein [Verrucomicrobia bacterium]|nr:RNA-binding transcriptional accessory protein [Verrucomicrobiota bacterium]
MIEKHLVQITAELGLQPRQVAATAVLLEEGATVPFIARYRKESTGELDEVKITAIRDRLEQLEVLDKRRESIIASLEERKLLTEELRFKVETASSLNSLEDIYLPFKPRKRTRATIAKELGLEPLSEILWAQDPATDPEALAVPYVGNSVTVDAKTSTLDTVAAVLAGARDILAERINDDSTLRAQLRSLYLNKGVIKSTLISGKEEEGAKFKDYFDWSEPAATAPSHRILAMRRGETEGFLYFRLTPPENEALGILFMLFVKGNSRASEQVKLACEDCLKRLVGFAMEVEARGFYKKKADEESIRVFADNLRELLLASPLGQKITLGIDPGFRTGCKIVLLDRQGKLLANEVIYPGRSRGEELEAAEAILNIVRLHKVEAIAIGNGTASRETESFVKKLKLPSSIQIVVVSESGASIYSASEIAREEFPDLDLTVRGAVSIGRRLMDPLAELVKLDPKSIGVGQYQHDVDQAALKRSLDDVVISCVNKVGVELNTASRHLLAYVSGLNSRTAASLVSHRDTNGPFKSRAELLKISGLGPKAFEQAAGFLRIRDGAHPLDASSVHPERYELVDRMAADLGCSVADLLRDPAKRSAIKLESYATPEVGLPTLKDIVAELAKPGRDPREQFEAFSFADGVEKMEDLQPGMKLPGIVTNVTAFGAFVDIGVHQDGLVHISQISDDFVQNPAEFLKVGQKVQTTVMEVDLPRKRIALSLKTKVDLTPRDPKGGGTPGGDRRGQGGRGEDLSRFMRNDSGKPGTGGDWFSQAQQKKF